MRSDMVKKGDARAAHRSLLRATGVKEEDFNKPFIAICCSYTDVVPGHVHLGKVAEMVKQLVRDAGGVPFVFNTIAVDDGIAMGHVGMKYSLASRELIADCVETMVNAHCFDGMICIPNCDKIVPGMLMASIRCNIPTIFVSGGPMEAGSFKGEATDLISTFIGAAAKQNGRMTAEELLQLEQTCCPTCGSCSGMFTANSMNCLCEALGMALPMNGTLLATSADRKRLFEKAAKRIVEMVYEYEEKGDAFKCLPRDIITRESVDNAIVLDMAMGGSTNTVCTRWPSLRKPISATTSTVSTSSAVRRRTSAKSRRASTTTSKTFTTRAESTRSWAKSAVASRVCSSWTRLP